MAEIFGTAGLATQNSPASGQPALSAALHMWVETLTANTTGIADTDGLTNATFSYQPTRNDGASDADIQGAASARPTPWISNDEGKTIKVRVSFTDDEGNSESLTSAATATVEALLHC